MSKYSAEEQVSALLRALVLDTEFAVDELKKDVAVFALIVWVATARKLQREFRRSGRFVRVAGLDLAQAVVATKFRSYSRHLEAQIEGIIQARKQRFVDGMLQVSGDVRFTKSAKVSADKLRVMEYTLHDTFATLLRTFQQRLVVQIRTALSGVPVVGAAIGASLADAEDVYDRLGGAFPEDGFPDRQKLAERAHSLVGKVGAAARFAQDILQMTGDFAHTGLVDTIWPLFRQSSVVAGVAAQVVVDDATSQICRGLVGGAWDASTGKPLQISAVSVDFPGPPPYHRSCRTMMTPIFHEGVLPSGVRATGQPPSFTGDSWRKALPKEK